MLNWKLVPEFLCWDGATAGIFVAGSGSGDGSGLGSGTGSVPLTGTDIAGLHWCSFMIAAINFETACCCAEEQPGSIIPLAMQLLNSSNILEIENAVR